MNDSKVAPDNALRDTIAALFREVYLQQVKRAFEGPLGDETLLLETSLDSLGYAVLVYRLEESLGYDPFLICTEAVYPKTFGEFVAFYARYKPRDVS